MREGWRPPPLKDHQARRLIEDIQTIGRDRRHRLDLTARERQVVALMADGLTASEIAVRLQRASSTIVSMEKQIRRKLGARNNAHAVAISLRCSAPSSS